MNKRWIAACVACAVFPLLTSMRVAADPPATKAAEVSVSKAPDNSRHVKTPQYEAEVAADGCLSGITVKGRNLLKPGVGVSRGAYCFQHGTIPLPQITQPDENTVVAEANAKPSVTYAFGVDSIRLSVANKTAGDLQYVLVLDPLLDVVESAEGQMLKAPARQDWPDATWLGNGCRLRIAGATKIWGPYLGGTNVVEADLAPGQTRTLTLEMNDAGEAEAHLAADARAGKRFEGGLAIDSPKPFEVFQRLNKESGFVRVSGRVKPRVTAVEVQLRGKAADATELPDRWKEITLDQSTRSFNAQIPTPAGGWYTLDVRARNNDQVVAQARVASVGVGEVFIIAGQSNSTNYGQIRQEPASGLASTFDGDTWRLAADPQPGTHDNSTGGSPWPAFADTLAQRFHVPVGIASTGHGGTSINAWQAGGDLFNHTLSRVNQLGYLGFRALLWHQGESDTEMPSDEYFRKLAGVIEASKRSAGWEFPWFVAQASYHSPTARSFNTTRDAQKKLWDERIALEGPDTDTLAGDNRDANGAGIHLSAKGLAAHGRLWADKVGIWLDKELNAPSPAAAAPATEK